MAYNKLVWQDYPNTTTPINAENLNRMEDGIDGAMTKTNPRGDGNFVMNPIANNYYAANCGSFGTSNRNSQDCSFTAGYDNTASGMYSQAVGKSCTASNTSAHAEGYTCIASGYASHAEGYEVTVEGAYSHGEGYNNTINTGCLESHVEGYGNVVKTSMSHAEGQGNRLENWASVSHVEGYNNVVNGGNSHAEGSSNFIATGSDNHVEGTNCRVGDETHSPSSSHAEGSRTTVLASDAHAEGYGTTASGGNSHAEGGETNATAYCSHSEGWQTTASGEYSHAQGKNTVASGESSFASGYNVGVSGNYSGAVGYGLTTERPSTFAVGKFNLDNGALFSVGNGNNENDRKNVFWVQDNGFIYAEDIFIMCKNSFGEKTYTPLGMAFMDGEKPGMWSAINDIAGRLNETVQIEGSTYNNQIGFGFDVATSSLKVAYKYYEYDESQGKAVRKTKYYKIAMEEYEPEE